MDTSATGCAVPSPPVSFAWAGNLIPEEEHPMKPKPRPRKRKPRRVLGDWRKLFDQMTEGERFEMVCLMLKKIESRQHAGIKKPAQEIGT